MKNPLSCLTKQSVVSHTANALASHVTKNANPAAFQLTSLRPKGRRFSFHSNVPRSYLLRSYSRSASVLSVGMSYRHFENVLSGVYVSVMQSAAPWTRPMTRSEGEFVEQMPATR